MRLIPEFEFTEEPDVYMNITSVPESELKHFRNTSVAKIRATCVMVVFSSLSNIPLFFFTVEPLGSSCTTEPPVARGRGGIRAPESWDYIWGNWRSLRCRRVLAGGERRTLQEQNIWSDRFGTVWASLGWFLPRRST